MRVKLLENCEKVATNQSCCLNMQTVQSATLHPKGCFCWVRTPHPRPPPVVHPFHFSLFFQIQIYTSFAQKWISMCCSVQSSPYCQGAPFFKKKKKFPLAVCWARLRPGRYLRWGDLSLQSWFGSKLSVAWRRSGLQSLQRCLQPHTHTYQHTGKSWLSALHIQFSLQHGTFSFTY